MENYPMERIVISLKKMVECCIEMQALLENDSVHFSMNNATVLEENNKRKAEVIEKLSMLANDLKTKNPEGYLQQLLQSKDKKGNTEYKDLHTVMNKLKNEIEKCYTDITVNRTIVQVNTQYIKEVWEQLLSYKTGSVPLYDNKGLTVK